MSLTKRGHRRSSSLPPSFPSSITTTNNTTTISKISKNLAKWAKQKLSGKKSTNGVTPVVSQPTSQRRRSATNDDDDDSTDCSVERPSSRHGNRISKSLPSRRRGFDLENLDLDDSALVDGTDYDNFTNFRRSSSSSLGSSLTLPEIQMRDSFYSEMSDSLETLAGITLPEYSADASTYNFPLEAPTMIYGSVQHFAYLRMLKKLEVGDRPRPLSHTVVLNILLARVVCDQLTPFELRELRTYKDRILYQEAKEREQQELQLERDRYVNETPRHRRRRPPLPSESLHHATSNSRRNSRTSQNNRKLPPYLACRLPLSRVISQHRPSYASKAVVTAFDESTTQKLVTRDVVITRRPGGNGVITNDSTDSSSSSSLKTVASNSPFTLQFAALSKSLFKRSLESDEIKSDKDEDEVSLFVLKEQYRYSGKGNKVTTGVIPSSILERTGGTQLLVVG